MVLIIFYFKGIFKFFLIFRVYNLFLIGNIFDIFRNRILGIVREDGILIYWFLYNDYDFGSYLIICCLIILYMYIKNI